MSWEKFIDDMPPPTSMLSETLPPSMVYTVRLPAPSTLTVNSALNCATSRADTSRPVRAAAKLQVAAAVERQILNGVCGMTPWISWLS